MKKQDVRTGATYLAKVSGGVVPVRITGEKWAGDKHTGWVGVNTETGRSVRIKSAQRLRAAAAPATATKEATKGKEAPAAPKAPKAKAAKGKPAKPKKDRPMSGLDAAAKILADAGEPMKVKDIVAAAAKKGLWKSANGKTPEATVYAAIIREIFNKQGQSRFVKKDRGLFAAAGKGR